MRPCPTSVCMPAEVNLPAAHYLLRSIVHHELIYAAPHVSASPWKPTLVDELDKSCFDAEGLGAREGSLSTIVDFEGDQSWCERF